MSRSADLGRLCRFRVGLPCLPYHSKSHSLDDIRGLSTLREAAGLWESYKPPSLSILIFASEYRCGFPPEPNYCLQEQALLNYFFLCSDH